MYCGCARTWLYVTTTTISVGYINFDSQILESFQASATASPTTDVHEMERCMDFLSRVTRGAAPGKAQTFVTMGVRVYENCGQGRQNRQAGHLKVIESIDSPP